MNNGNRPMEVPIGTKNVEELIKKLKEAKKEASDFKKEVKGLNDELKNTKTPKKQSAASGSSAGSNSGNASGNSYVNPNAPTLQFPQTATGGSGSAGGNGGNINAGGGGKSPGATPGSSARNTRPPVADPYQAYVHRRLQAQQYATQFKQQYGQQPQGFNYAKAFRQTRFKVGNAQVLGTTIEDAVGAFGGDIASVGGPLGAPYAAYKIGEAEFRGAQSSSRAMQPIVDTYYRSGGTASEAARAAALSGGNAGRPESFADTLRGGGYGSAYFREHGFTDIGQFQADKATNYIGALDYFRHDRSLDRNMRTRIGRSAGLDSREMMLTDPNLLGEDSYQNLMHSYDTQGSAGAIKRKNEFDTNVEATKNSFESLKTIILGPAIKKFAEAAGGAASALDFGDSPGLIPSKNQGVGIYHAIRGLASIFNPIAGLLPNLGYDKVSTPTPVDSSTNGIDAFRESRQEIIGGGGRARSIPIGQNYGAVVNGVNNDTYRMGAF